MTAAQMTSSYDDIEAFREAIVQRAFGQTSYLTRYRYASYFIKWFLPNVSMRDPVGLVWEAFRDENALRHVMRWQYVTSNPLVARFVEGPFSSVTPGESVEEAVVSYLLQAQGALNRKVLGRLRTSMRKIGLLVVQGKTHYRIVPEVSTRAVAFLLACVFAPEAQVLSWNTLVTDPWWKRLGIVDETMLREKLRETAEEGLISRFRQVDTLDQITTRYSLEQFEKGEARRPWQSR